MLIFSFCSKLRCWEKLPLPRPNLCSISCLPNMQRGIKYQGPCVTLLILFSYFVLNASYWMYYFTMINSKVQIMFPNSILTRTFYSFSPFQNHYYHCIFGYCAFMNPHRQKCANLFLLFILHFHFINMHFFPNYFYLALFHCKWLRPSKSWRLVLFAPVTGGFELNVHKLLRFANVIKMVVKFSVNLQNLPIIWTSRNGRDDGWLAGVNNGKRFTKRLPGKFQEFIGLQFPGLKFLERYEEIWLVADMWKTENLSATINLILVTNILAFSAKYGFE